MTFQRNRPPWGGRELTERRGVWSEIWACVNQRRYRISISRDRGNVTTSMWRALFFVIFEIMFGRIYVGRGDYGDYSGSPSPRDDAMEIRRVKCSIYENGADCLAFFGNRAICGESCALYFRK